MNSPAQTSEQTQSTAALQKENELAMQLGRSLEQQRNELRTELEQCKAENEFFYERGYRLGAQSGFNLGAKQDPLGLERLLAGHAYPRPQSATNGAIAAQSSEGKKG